MQINNVYNLFFSPTGRTKAVLDILHQLNKSAKDNITDVDLTPYAAESLAKQFAPEDIVYIGVPSYAGRVPQVFAQRLARITAKGSLAVLIVTFGNRAYEDTLIELKDLAEKCGFKVIAAAAVVTQHSIITKFGEGRPDELDKQQLAQFNKAVAEKIKTAADLNELIVAGNRPYKQVKPMPLAPQFNEADCIGCGICAASCPTGAIDEQSYICTAAKCISCLRCIKVCPLNCRFVNSELLQKLETHLAPLCKTRKDNEFFY